MADMGASVLARLKGRRKKVAEVISFACNCFAKKNFYVVWKNQSMLKILFLKAGYLYILLLILTAV